jgi:molybdopterin molybdotransferase
MVHYSRMISTQRLPASLTPLDAALAALVHRLEPVAPIELPLAEALGCVAADMPPLMAHPLRDVASGDGWAMRARDLVGASSYSPLPLSTPPTWVEAGDAMPDGCDCVLDADTVDQAGPLVQVMAEAIPGQRVRRAGGDIAEGSVVAVAGRRILPRDLLIARTAGLQKLTVRRPRLRIVSIPGGSVTADLILESARRAGADGGSGVGRTDATVMALARRGDVVVHGLAVQPGRTTAIGRIGATPVIALPGASEDVFAAWCTLALPALDRLSGRRPGQSLNLPLARKIASGVGVAELVLLERKQTVWTTLAVGQLSLEAIARAEAWLVVPAGSEGFAAGTPVDAYMLRE